MHRPFYGKDSYLLKIQPHRAEFLVNLN